jgi:hypothetical protein
MVRIKIMKKSTYFFLPLNLLLVLCEGLAIVQKIEIIERDSIIAL